ncbi:hypothetical protein T08_8955 [Trichinella sp. T8]|nr:hypothetical protein T08_8955 [Trichinella sp. T8]
MTLIAQRESAVSSSSEGVGWTRSFSAVARTTAAWAASVGKCWFARSASRTMDKSCCQGSFRLEYNCRLSSALRRPRKNWSLTSVSSQWALRPSSIIASAYAISGYPGSCRRKINLARASIQQENTAQRTF